MWIHISGLGVSLLAILVCCELFTNAIEWLGHKMKVGDGVVGSIFSAVGTCLPETMIPVIAILFSNQRKNSMDVGIGAIVGAPFMLGTLAFFITGFSVLVFWKKRKTRLEMHVNNKVIQRDIAFFIVVYSIGIGVSYTGSSILRYITCVFLVCSYIYYIFLTVKSDSGSHGKLEKLYAQKFLDVKPELFYIVLQIVIALSGIILSAHLFVQNIEYIADTFQVPALVLSLIIAPVATELPEKFNSVLWIRKNKDTLALGNITGAMVFQSCIPVAIGIYATRWKLDIEAVASAALVVVSACFVYWWIRARGKLSPFPLIMGGAFYFTYLYLIFKGYSLF